MEDLLKRLTPDERGRIPLVEDLLNGGPPGTGAGGLAPNAGDPTDPTELLDFLLGP